MTIFNPSSSGAWSVLGDTTTTNLQTNIDFTSLPACKVIEVYVWLKDATAGDSVLVRLNNDNSAAYTTQRFLGNGALALAQTLAGQTGFLLGTLSTATFCTGKFTIVNAAEAVTSKKILSQWEDGDGAISRANSCLTPVTGAVSRITVLNDGGNNFSIGSRVIILGVRV